ncbi:MAG TPA: hypothetical protein VM346_04690 [Sphingomicrobium sp.]|nr:hypothetical protein [Sphingomicrobium sp.]
MRVLRPYPRAAALAAAALLLSCRPADTGDSANVVTNNQSAETPALPIAEPPIDRETLLIAAMRAASAQATGRDDSEAQRLLEGKRFEVRVRFGCRPDDQEGQAFAVRFDEQRRTLRLSAAPDLTAEEPLTARIAGEEVATVEGFWLRRPWLLAAACPAAPAQPEGDEPPAEATEPREPPAYARIGIAQFFREGDARTFQRRQRPYESTKTLAEGENPSAEGYNLVLSGRLRRLPNRRVISCAAASFDGPPDCIISVVFDRVWFERPDSRDIIAQWSRG